MPNEIGQRTWNEYTENEKKLTISLTFVAGYARMRDLETQIIALPGSDGELARLKRWWHNLSQEKRDTIKMWVETLPVECEVYAAALAGGGH